MHTCAHTGSGSVHVELHEDPQSFQTMFPGQPVLGGGGGGLGDGGGGRKGNGGGVHTTRVYTSHVWQLFRELSVPHSPSPSQSAPVATASHLGRNSMSL